MVFDLADISAVGSGGCADPVVIASAGGPRPLCRIAGAATALLIPQGCWESRLPTSLALLELECRCRRRPSARAPGLDLRAISDVRLRGSSTTESWRVLNFAAPTNARRSGCLELHAGAGCSASSGATPGNLRPRRRRSIFHLLHAEHPPRSGSNRPRRAVGKSCQYFSRTARMVLPGFACRSTTGVAVISPIRDHRLANCVRRC